MGSGKTTVGKALARRLGARLRDTDADIETVAGKPIPEIFVDDGEQHFRALERSAVAQALAGHDGILSLGGGAVLAPETQELLRGHRVVFLNLSMPVGVRRTGMATNRPLLSGVNPRATYKALLDARLPIYRGLAVLEVDTDHRTADQVAVHIIEELDLS
ncbi:shikimate kinase [Nakamurella sp. YIM 132087]|uniref:Shikimate kinase n=1 Tax=Nakamurella alba TaxID=2665158 RepID=A0A7K1FFQ1_9ACTN|nr:shikimate kinase [Nakamurella alba]